MKHWKPALVIMARFLMIGSAALILSRCGGGGSCSDIADCVSGPGGSSEDNGGNPATPPPPIVGSSGTASGSVGIYTYDGATYVLTPGAAGGKGTVNLLTLPNTGGAVGAISVPQLLKTSIPTSLTTISGISVDPVNDVGISFDSNDHQISVFSLSTAQEIGTYDTQTAHPLTFSSGLPLIAGAIMNPADKTIILATGDGFEILDYADPAAPAKIREIPSLQSDPVNGVEVMENFAFDPALPIGDATYALIITGGGQAGPDHALELVDAETGQVFRPDASTVALLPLNDYIDAAAVDTSYHVVVMAEEEGSHTYFIDLKAAVLDASSGTFNLPAAAVGHISLYFKYTNLAIESTNHLVMMGKGCGGTDAVIGLLEDPSIALTFGLEAPVAMPVDTDDAGNTVTWAGWCDPHGAAAYLTSNNHLTSPKVAMGLWLNASGDHVAVINLQNVLDGTLSSETYDPTAPSPKDIEYLAIP
jgi:hypothetical protein